MHVVMERGPRPGESDGPAADEGPVPDADELAAQALLDALARPNGSGVSGRHGRRAPTLGAGGLVTRVVDSFRSARAWWVAAAVVVGGTVLLLVARPASTAVPVELPRASAAPASVEPGGSVGDTGSAAPAGSAGGTEASSTTVTSSVGSASASLVVHVAGAVLRPGLVTLPAGARTADALMAAGGPRPDADLERVNLAEPMSDGARWYVPTVGQEVLPSAIGASGPAAAGQVAASSGGGAAPTAPVDLNSADAALLDTLPGVGPSTAAAIVAYRSEHGRFGSVDELQEVRGIGPAKFASLEPLVVVR